MNGYKQKKYPYPTKRYVQRLDLKSDEEAIQLPQFGIVQTTNPNCLHYFP